MEKRKEHVYEVFTHKKPFMRVFEDVKRTKVIVERKVILRDFSKFGFPQLFQDQCWKGFINPYTNVDVELVREFYSSATVREPDKLEPEKFIKANVRGKEIKISFRLIKETLKYPDIPNPDIPEPSRRDIASEICRLYEDWDGKFPLNQGQLLDKYRILHLVVCHNLIPKSHQSSINIATAETLYTIGTGNTINVPSYIFDIIEKTVLEKSQSKSLGFGGIITEIIRQHGVRVKGKSYSVPIDYQTLRRSQNQSMRSFRARVAPNIKNGGVSVSREATYVGTTSDKASTASGEAAALDSDAMDENAVSDRVDVDQADEVDNEHQHQSYSQPSTSKNIQCSCVEVVRPMMLEIERKMEERMKEFDEKITNMERKMEEESNRRMDDMGTDPSPTNARVQLSKKKLLVLDVNGILADIVFDNKNTHRVTLRPHCSAFLEFCFQHFHVGVWSPIKMCDLDTVIHEVMGSTRKKLCFLWDESYCEYICAKGKFSKPLYLKDLRRVWTSTSLEENEFNETNTLLVDDSPYTTLKNPDHSAIFLETYDVQDVNDRLLEPEGAFCNYLKGMAEAENVQEYVKENPSWM